MEQCLRSAHESLLFSLFPSCKCLLSHFDDVFDCRIKLAIVHSILLRDLLIELAQLFCELNRFVAYEPRQWIPGKNFLVNFQNLR